MFGWGRMARPSPPGAAPQPQTTTGVFAAPTGTPPPPAAPLAQRLPPGELASRAPYVSQVPNRDGIVYMYSYGATQMPRTVPYPGGADGQVWRSQFQPFVRRLFAWAPSSRFGHIAPLSPHNLGITFRAPALRTQTTGGPGPGRMAGRPIFSRVQRIPRATREVPTYDTRSMGGRRG